MSLVFFDGFDYGVPAAPKWSAVSLSNAFTADSGRRTDTGALDLESTGDSVTGAITASTEIVIGFATKGYAEGVFLELYEGATKHVTFEWGASPNYFIIVKNGDGTTLHTDADVNDPTVWAYYEFRVKCHDTTGTVTVHRGDVEIIAITSQDTNNAGAVGTFDGWKMLGTHAGSTWYDDLYVVDTTDATDPVTRLGSSVRVDTLFPTADETSEWTNPTGASHHYAQVDETPYSDADYVESSTLNARELFLLDSLGYTPTNIYGVQVNLVAKEDLAGALEVAPSLKITGTHYAGTAVALDTTNKIVTHLWTTNPKSAIEWTRADVNALAAGAKITAV